MFTCRDGKGGKLSSQASKMLYKPPGAVYIASYKELLNQSDCRKLFVQLWNYTNTLYNSIREFISMYQNQLMHMCTWLYNAAASPASRLCSAGSLAIISLLSACKASSLGQPHLFISVSLWSGQSLSQFL